MLINKSCLLLTFLLSAWSASTVVVAGLQCNVDELQAVVPSDTTIVSAEHVASPVPFCSIEGYVTTQNPGPNQVGFLLSLPEQDWNGRFFFNSVGGAAGFLQAAGARLLVDGFAVATTDGGHRSLSMLDWSDLKDPAKAYDIGRRSVHASSVAAQALTKTYYGADKLYRYLQGCSGGGQRTLATARYYPEDYDGYIVGAPGINPGTILAFAHVTQHISRDPEGWLSPAELGLVESTVNAQCGAFDGVVANSLSCDFDVTSLQCSGDLQENCLSAKQVATAQLIARGPSSPEGQIYPGAPYTNTRGWIGFFTGQTPPPWDENDLAKAPGGYVIAHSFMRGYFGDDFDFVKDFDFNDQAQIDAYRAADAAAYMGQEDADLSSLKTAGGKIIFWHGMSDHGIVYEDMVRYFKELETTVAEFEKPEPFARLFAVPGVLHCGGGSGPTDAKARVLEKMIAWVEDGVVPDAMVAHRSSARGGEREFLICAYPKVAQFRPRKPSKSDPMAPLRGNPSHDANNWVCE